MEPQGKRPDASDTAEYVYRREHKYRAVVGADHEIVKRELRLLKCLADEVERRLPADLEEDERLRRGIEIVAADPNLSRMIAELEELAESRAGPALWQRLDADADE